MKQFDESMPVTIAYVDDLTNGAGVVVQALRGLLMMRGEGHLSIGTADSAVDSSH